MVLVNALASEEFLLTFQRQGELELGCEGSRTEVRPTIGSIFLCEIAKPFSVSSVFYLYVSYGFNEKMEAKA